MSPVTLPSPVLLTGVRLALAATLTAEFAAERIDFAPTKLNPKAAENQPTGAVFSLGWQEAPDINEILPRFGVQIFDQWMPDWNPLAQSYDPTLVESWVQRATVALKANEHAVGLWLLRVPQVAISDDPAGNPTQVELIVTGRTDNPFGF